jgi:hypothetical protein
VGQLEMPALLLPIDRLLVLAGDGEKPLGDSIPVGFAAHPGIGNDGPSMGILCCRVSQSFGCRISPHGGSSLRPLLAHSAIISMA